MTEFRSNSNGAGPDRLPTSQGLVCFHEDELGPGKTFLVNTITPIVEVLVRSGSQKSEEDFLRPVDGRRLRDGMRIYPELRQTLGFAPQQSKFGYGPLPRR